MTSLRALPLVLVVLACGCNKDDSRTPAEQPSTVKKGPGAETPARDGKTPAATPTPVKREMPKFGPLTEEAARAVLHAPLDQLGGDDESRQALLYLADLGDRAGVAAANKALSPTNGKVADVHTAAVAAEALLAYGEPDAGAKALAVAKQYADDEEDADEYLIRALGRVTGPERARAVEALLKIAHEGDEDVSALAAGELAKDPTPAVRDAFAAIAADGKLAGQVRGAAVAGLLHGGDPRGKDLADRLVKEATAEAVEAGQSGPVEVKRADGKPPETGAAADKPKPVHVNRPADAKPAGAPPADEASAPEADKVIAGLGVEGATEAAPYVAKTIDVLLAADDNASFEAPEAASALARIYVKGGGSDMLPWLRDWAKRDDFHEEEAAVAAFSLGDDASAESVAKQLEDHVALWSTPSQWGPAIDMLDAVARRGMGTSPSFRAVVDSAAQVRPAAGGSGVNTSLTGLNLAAAHAFLKSSGAKK